ncbi:hypothetical protein [Nitrosomonas ureae]|uniref:Uncharacterized protein n=1 Tax=Nitrosomonas ureae TaxID=44577 RepID=A0A2T5I1I1_9PROT|nr:hypothetical protein [Nitrosomonas ureae]PTQ77628.1 hypothetical protein C8R28_10732 [Nitrosomonas ureae]
MFRGTKYQAGSTREVVGKIFQLLAEADTGFHERFASRKHGKKRRYIAQEKVDLYPGRLDLAEIHSIEIIPGWWMGTNYSRSNFQQILNLALEVVEPQLRSLLKIDIL